MNPYHRSTILKGRLVAFFFGLATIANCTPALVVHQDFDPTANFGQYRTYHWLASDITGLEHQIDNRELIDRSVRVAVESALVKRGMYPDTESPDIRIAYYVVLGEQQGINHSNAATLGYGFAGIPNFKQTNAYTEGTLIIDLIQANSNELVWRGWAEADVKVDSLEEADIIRAVNYIFAQYPPGTASR